MVIRSLGYCHKSPILMRRRFGMWNTWWTLKSMRPMPKETLPLWVRHPSSSKQNIRYWMSGNTSTTLLMWNGDAIACACNTYFIIQFLCGGWLLGMICVLVHNYVLSVVRRFCGPLTIICTRWGAIPFKQKYPSIGSLSLQPNHTIT